MSSRLSGPVLALSGGVGGAKLAAGLAGCLGADELVVVANTADDFEHLGLAISPDLDSVMYALSGINDEKRGWGIAGESWAFMDQLARYDAEQWFRLGDRDLATHVLRSDALRRGRTLSQVTADLCRRLGVGVALLPMSDQPVRTLIGTDTGTLPFQAWFVRERCEPPVRSVTFDGIDAAVPNPLWFDRLTAGDFAAVIICPSNPFVSVEPILALPGVRAVLGTTTAPVLGVSPIIGGEALKGPAAKMLTGFDLPRTAAAVAGYYGKLLDGFIIDERDATLAGEIAATGTACEVTATIMKTYDDKCRLARFTLKFAASLAGRR